ncbi:MAG: hypothetical protein KDE25_10350 [Novosphingobium sp.]|nr:hypothetical protein [Novosphingobium sp.]
MLRALGFGVLGFILAAIATYLVVVVGTTVVWDLLDVHDQDGGGAMALGLVIGPICALFGGLIGAVMLPMWLADRRNRQPPEQYSSVRADFQHLVQDDGDDESQHQP